MAEILKPAVGVEHIAVGINQLISHPSLFDFCEAQRIASWGLYLDETCTEEVSGVKLDTAAAVVADFDESFSAFSGAVVVVVVVGIVFGAAAIDLIVFETPFLLELYSKLLFLLESMLMKMMFLLFSVFYLTLFL